MLKYIIDSNKVNFYLSDELVFTISDDLFKLSVGNGINSFTVSRGSFKIKEKKLGKTRLYISSVEEKSANLLVIHYNDYVLNVEIINDHLVFNPVGFDKFNRLYISIPSNKDEYIYGTGEIFSHFNLKGKKCNVWVAEHINLGQIIKKLLNIAVGNKNNQIKQKYSNYETYYAQPTYLSSKKYFFHTDATSKCVFNFKKNKETLLQLDMISNFYFGFGCDYENVVSELTTIVGRPADLPDWLYDGKILGIQGGTDIMMDKYHKVKDAGAAINGIWIQDWEGRRITAFGKQLMWNWEVDNELYPNLKEKIKELNNEGVKVLGYCNTFLAIEKDLYKEGSPKGYMVHDKEGKDYLVTITTFPAAIVDLTNPDACTWLKGIIKKNLIEFGLSGWMADFGEYLPTDAVLYSGEDAELVHNTWPARWAKLNYECLEETGNLGKIMFFTRAGFTGNSKYTTMMWNGDNHVDFSIDFGLQSVIPAALSMTCIGTPLCHSDIGGYTTFWKLRRSKNLYMRWQEMNAFSLVMRSHEGNQPDLNVQFDFDEELINHTAVMSNIHKKLKPYLKSLVKDATTKGIGVVRPLFFYYNSKKDFTECYEYLLGKDVLVAPVLKENKTKQKVYLPDDEWIHIETGNIYTGGSYMIDAPITKIPVFVRKNASKEVKELLLSLYEGEK